MANEAIQIHIYSTV